MNAPNNERNGSLDFYRAIAIILVLLYHTPRSSQDLVVRAISHYGWAGVDLFFVLSGFLIGRQVFQSLLNNNFNFRIFFLKRFIRTLPTYFFTIIICYLLKIFIDNIPISYYVFLQNLTEELNYLSVSWSLCIEEHFYIIFPLAVFFIFKKRNYHQLSKYLLFSMLAITAAIRLYKWAVYRPDHFEVDLAYHIYLNKIYYNTFCRLDGLLFGVSISYIFIYNNAYFNRISSFIKKRSYIVVTTWILGLILSEYKFSAYNSIFGFFMIALACTLLLLYIYNNSFFNEIGRLPAIRLVSEASYSLYLTHTISSLILTTSLNYLGVSNTKLIYSISLVVVGFTTHYLVEKPFLKLRPRLITLLTQKA